MKTKIFCLLLLVVQLDFSCKKEPGPGGTSTIRGKVYARKYDLAFTTLQNQYYAPKEDVFLIYGTSASYNDNIKTNYDGTFEFRYLRQGSYKVYTYSKDSAKIVKCFGCLYIPDSAVIQTIEIKKNNQVVELPDMVILK